MVMKRLSKHEGGFTLVEVMIALFVGALLIMISYNVLTTQKRASEAQKDYVGAQQNARIALESLEKELRVAGLNIDDFNNQPIFIDAAPYQVVFNADISSGIGGVPGMEIGQSVPLSDGSHYSPGMYPGENIGTLQRYNNNAETIRYTLDHNDDGIVDSSDQYGRTDNLNDYGLYREENGTKKDIIAYGIRGRENYPDGQFPAPLFKYYGDFNNNGQIVMWGDNDGDGVLSQAEIATLTRVTAPQLSKIIEVEITVEGEGATLEAGYAGPHSAPGNPRGYRSVVMTSKVRPRNVGTGSANLHACGVPPAVPTSLTGADTPKDNGTSITLTFSASYDEEYGEKDVESYTVYRKWGAEGDWQCIGSVLPELQSAYTYYDNEHSIVGGPEIGQDYYYYVSAWDCRPQESAPSNIVGPVQPLPNGPRPPVIVDGYDTPCDNIPEISVILSKSPDDIIDGGYVYAYDIYRGVVEGGGLGTKMLVGHIDADGSDYYQFLDNATNNMAEIEPEIENFYYYIAIALGSSGGDTISSVNSNEYGGVYYSGTISACQLTSVIDYPDDEGTALVLSWRKSPSEDCVENEVEGYAVMRKSIYEPQYVEVHYAYASGQTEYGYLDEGLVRGNEYTYRIYTVSTSNEHIPSNELSAIPLRNTQLDPPTDLVAEDILCEATGAINVTFNHSPQDVSGGRVTNYNIYRWQEFGAPLKVGEMPADASESYLYVDGPATNPTNPPLLGEFYYYSATAYDTDNARESAQSSPPGYTMSDGEPGAPYITQAYDTPTDAGGSITVLFDRSADDGHCSSNVIYYRVYRAGTETGPFDQIVGELTAMGQESYTFYDDELFSMYPPVDGVPYYYVIRAVEDNPVAGTRESVNSNVMGPVFSISQDPSSYIVFQDDFETDKGWTHGYERTQDDWQRGAPAGTGGDLYGYNDPTTAYSGVNVYGNDVGLGGMDGRYRNNVENYLITPQGALNCYGHANVVLQFYRWLNVEAPAYDQARIYISNTGTNGPWSIIWENPTEITDNQWVFMQIDISQWADGNSDVAIMFWLKTDGQHEYAGWNIDDVVVREQPSYP
jgi:prepilin-type N-terminal cleavage/methylation domain-containing protein